MQISDSSQALRPSKLYKPCLSCFVLWPRKCLDCHKNSNQEKVKMECALGNSGTQQETVSSLCLISSVCFYSNYAKACMIRSQQEILRYLWELLVGTVSFFSWTICLHFVSCFKEIYPKCRGIIDASEITAQAPSSMVLISKLYLHYKNHTSYKGNVVIVPSVEVIYISSLYEGSISDKDQ